MKIHDATVVDIRSVVEIERYELNWRGSYFCAYRNEATSQKASKSHDATLVAIHNIVEIECQ